MVKGKGNKLNASEFAGGLVPALGGGLPVDRPVLATPPYDEEEQPPQQQRKSVVSASTSRKRYSIYLDDPDHADVIDSLLTVLRSDYRVPRDNSMLVRALLNMARDWMANDIQQIEVLAQYCHNTLPRT